MIVEMISFDSWWVSKIVISSDGLKARRINKFWNISQKCYIARSFSIKHIIKWNKFSFEGFTENIKCLIQSCRDIPLEIIDGTTLILYFWQKLGNWEWSHKYLKERSW